ncbi:MAG: hypothetical protein WC331_05260 [Candidatus Omnitrophota bacterium]|jgi:hypothetical protein
MKKVPPSFEKYSVIEISLAGQDLRAGEKASARELLLSCRIPERSHVFSDYKGTFRISCYTRSARKVLEIREKCKALKCRPNTYQFHRRWNWGGPGCHKSKENKNQGRPFAFRVKRLKSEAFSWVSALSQHEIHPCSRNPFILRGVLLQ